jgi:CTP synthase
LNPEYTVRVAMVGKYVELPDAYKSVNEALLHAGIQNRVKVQIDYVNAEDLEQQDMSIESMLMQFWYQVVLVNVVLKAK